MPFFKEGATIPEKGRGSKLSHKMQAFVDHYMVEMRADQAVILAGYKTKNVKEMAAQLLRHPLVKAEIEKRKNERREKNELTVDYVLMKLQSIVEDTEQDNPQAALRGLELLGKHLAMFKERTEISGPDGKAIEMEQRVKEDVSDFQSKLTSIATRAGKGGIAILPKPRSSSQT